MIRAALFDFDGTLADSFAAIAASTNHVRGVYGLPPMAEPDVRQYVGLGLENLLARLVPTAPPADAVIEYRKHHAGVMLELTTLLPGVDATLAELRRRGVPMAVCSNKSVAFTKRLIAGLGLAETFPDVLGPEDVGAAKPDPAMLLEACRRLGVPPAAAVYVGDMAVDVVTAKAAGIPVWLVPNGAAGTAGAVAAGPDLLLELFAQILDLIPEPR